MLLQGSGESVIVQSDGTISTKSEPVMLERPNNTGDHDDYTIAPKRLKAEPPQLCKIVENLFVLLFMNSGMFIENINPNDAYKNVFNGTHT